MNYHFFHGSFIFGLNKTDLNDLFGGGNILMKWGENPKALCRMALFYLKTGNR
jgi:hypothetical protein